MSVLQMSTKIRIHWEYVILFISIFKYILHLPILCQGNNKSSSCNELLNPCKLGFLESNALQILGTVNYSLRMQLSASNTFTNYI
jgi:hypothetical protein